MSDEIDVTASALIEEGNRHEDAGRFLDALKRYDEAVRLAPTLARAHLSRGNALLALKNAADAAGAYTTALRHDPQYAAAYYKLGNAYVQMNRRHEAIRAYGQALAMDPRFDDAAIALGFAYEAIGRPLDAITAYRLGLEINPLSVAAHGNLGSLLAGLGRFDEAISSFRRAIELEHKVNPGIFWMLGNSLARIGQLNDALGCFRKVVDADPQNPFAHNSLGLVLEDLLHHAEAAECYRQALQLRPDFSEAWFNLGNALSASKRLSDAVHSYEQALRLKPGYPEAELNLGSALFMQELTDQAVAAYRRAIALKPDLAEAHEYLGNALKLKRLLEEAVNSYHRAIQLRPNYLDAHLHLGDTLLDQDRGAEAQRCFERVIALDPDRGDARWSLVAARLPAVYGVNADPASCRKAFAQELERFEHWCNGKELAQRFKSFRIQTQFYLAYREENNRDLIRHHGSVCARIASAQLGERVITTVVPDQDRRIRIGVVSHHFRSHSVWHAIVKGWFQRLDRDRFDLYAYHLETTEDTETQFARGRATHFEQGKRDLRAWVDTITGHHLDVLIYPEIGMEFLAAQLASLRLAPAQIATWGHPETTGLPTIDYYLSAEDLEPANPQENYTEKLVALPSLGCFYEPYDMDVAAIDITRLGIDPEMPLLLCAGVPYKYAPEHDSIFPEIARRLGRCQFAFFDFPYSPRMSEKLRDRLRDVFARSGVDFSASVVFLPWQESADFFGLLRRADVYLDTIGFSGFNTAMKAVECGLPIVTREGRFLRGRLASGILKRMGLHELVAHSDAEYVDRVVELAADADQRGRVVRRIESSRHVLYKDSGVIQALEAFLLRVTAA